MENKTSVGNFIFVTVVFALWFALYQSAELAFRGDIGEVLSRLDTHSISNIFGRWVPFWIISVGFVPAVESARNLTELIKSFAAFFVAFVFLPMLIQYSTFSNYGGASFPFGAILRNLIPCCVLTFLVVLVVSKSMVKFEKFLVSTPRQLVCLFVRSIWPVLVFLGILIALLLVSVIGSSNAASGLLLLPVMGFGHLYGLNTLAFLSSAIVCASYGQRNWLIWLSFFSAIVMVLPMLSTLVYPEGKLIVFSVAPAWLLIFWFCRRLSGSLVGLSRNFTK